MKDFEFNIPTKIIFGHQAQKQAGRLTAAYGRKALILYGSERICKNGLLPEIMGLLEAEGVECELFGGIRENPLLSKAEEASRIVKEKKIEVLIAIGGGSVIDTAKAVSIGGCTEQRLWDYYEQRAVPKKTLPVGVILTMAATASEANCVSVIQNEKIHKKAALRCPLTYPRFALLNPELTYTVPKVQTAIGAMDIFAHAFERYFHTGQRGTLRLHLCAAVMKTVLAELPGVQKHPREYEGRAQLMWAATMAHSDMIGLEGVYACHAMSHVLTEAFHIPHGEGLAILMPAWCKYMLTYQPQDMAEFAVRIWDVNPQGKSPDTVAQEGISRFQNFICRSGLPVTLREAGIVHSDSRRLAEETMKAGQPIGENYKELNVDGLQAIFELARG